MPWSAGMHESGVRMVREKAMDGFFNNLLERGLEKAVHGFFTHHPNGFFNNLLERGLGST